MSGTAETTRSSRAASGRARRAAAALTAIGSLALTAACTADDPTPDETASIAMDLPPKDLAHWVLPADQYYVGMFSTSFGAASDALFSTCMTSKGFPMQPLPVRDESQRDPVFNFVQRRLFDPDLAATYGYHTAATLPGTPAQLFAAELKQASGQLPEGDGAQAAWDGCMSESLEPFPKVPDEPLGHELATAASEEANKSETVATAAAAWKECMRPLGIADLPSSPTEFPSKGIGALIDTGDADGGTVSLPSAQELQIAQQDAACRDSSGWRQAFYDAQWDAEVALMPENLSTLTAEQKAFDDRDGAAQKILNSR